MKKFIATAIFSVFLGCIYGQYTGNISWNVSEVLTSQSGIYNIVRMPQCTFEDQPGEPCLPVITKKYVIPYNAVVNGISVTGFTKQQLTGSFYIVPVQPQSQTNGEAMPDSVGPDSLIYNSMIPFPGNLVEIRKIAYFMDYKVVTVTFHPVEYQPLASSLFLYQNLQFTIDYTLDTIAYTFPLQISNTNKQFIQSLVSGIVENPADVAIVSGGVNNIPAGNLSDYLPTSSQFPTNLDVFPQLLLITINDFAESFKPFVEWKNKKGVPVVTATLENDILKLYQGSDSAQKIRNYIADMQFRFGEGLMVLFGGDINIIPTRMALCNGIESPCDLYFGAINLNDFSNWNGDGDQIFGEPEDNVFEEPINFIGRIPVRDTGSIRIYIRKMMEYEKLTLYGTQIPIDPSFRNRTLELVGSLNPTNDTTWKNQVSLNINSYIPHSPTSLINLLNDCPSSTPPPYISESALGKTAALNELNKPPQSGYNICIHYDHSGPATMGTSEEIRQEKLLIPDVTSLNNYNATSIMLSPGCEVLRFSENSISKALINNGNSGNLIFIGKNVSTGDGFIETGRMINRIFNDDRIAFNHAGKYFGTEFQENNPSNNPRQFNMLGDPDLPIWKNDPPTPLTLTTNISTFHTGTNTFPLTVSGLSINQEARICISKDDDVYVIDNFSGTGSVVRQENVYFSTPGIASVVLSSKNHIPVELQFQVESGINPVLYLADFILDDSSPGTVGNKDSQLDEGETAGIKIRLLNGGLSASGAISSAQLSTESLKCTVPAAYQYDNFPNIPPGSATPVAQANKFGIQVVSNGVTDQETARFRLILPLQSPYPACTTTVRVPIHTPKLEIYSVNAITSDGDNDIEPGETVQLFITLKNTASGMRYHSNWFLNSPSSDIILTSSMSTYPDITGYSNGTNTIAFEFQVKSTWNPATSHLFVNLSSGTSIGRNWVFSNIDLTPPAKPTGLTFSSNEKAIKLWWTPVPGARGYNVYRSDLPEGPFMLQNYEIIEGISLFNDLGLEPKSVFYYRVSAVSASGIEGPMSDMPALKAWTTFPLHEGWPVTNVDPNLGFATHGSPMTEDINNDGQKEVFLSIGNDAGLSSSGGLLGLTSSGNEIPGYLKPTSGNPYTQAMYPYQGTSGISTPAVVDIDQDGQYEIIATTYDGDPSLDAKRTFAFSTTEIDDDNRPGIKWESYTERDYRGSTIASFDGDESYETAIKGPYATPFYVLNSLGQSYEPLPNSHWPVENPIGLIGNGAPVIADLDLDGNKEFIIAINVNQGLKIKSMKAAASFPYT